MVKFITSKGFTIYLCSLVNIPIENVLYSYDAENGKKIILEAKNSIYLFDNMDDSLMNPIQVEEVEVRVDTRPKRYYPDDRSKQLVSFLDGTKTPVLYDGDRPYLPIIITNKDEVHNYRRLKIR